MDQNKLFRAHRRTSPASMNEEDEPVGVGGRSSTVKHISQPTLSPLIPCPLILLLSMCDDVNEILIIQVAGHIWRESCKHLVYL